MDIMLDHNYSAKPNDNLQLDDSVAKYNINKTMICQEVRNLKHWYNQNNIFMYKYLLS